MNSIDKNKQFLNIIKSSKSIVFFGGAGVSTSSGIPDFRSDQGIYKYTSEEVLSHDFFINHPQEFYDFYFKKMVFLDATPNPCHYALTYLESKNKLKSVITQNIDGLHQKAKTVNVLELHGTIHKNHCMKCHKFYSINELMENGYYCKCGGLIKPDVVLYNEQLDDHVILEAVKQISNCDTLIVAGTSLKVYPAASFVQYFKGKNLVIINLQLTSYDQNADLVINDKVENYLNIPNLETLNL